MCLHLHFTGPIAGIKLFKIQESSVWRATDVLGEGNVLTATVEKIGSSHQIKVKSNRRFTRRLFDPGNHNQSLITQGSFLPFD